MQSLERYRELAQLLVKNLAYTAQLGISSDRKLSDQYAETISDLFTGYEKRILQVMGLMIDEEIANTAEEALGSVLRGNNALTKLEVEFVKRHAKGWLRDALGPVLGGILHDCAFYEVDPEKIRSVLGSSASTEEITSVVDLGKESGN